MMSPAMAAAAAVTGTLTDIRQLDLTVIPMPERGAVMTSLYSQTEASAGAVIREVVAGQAKIAEVDANAGNFKSIPCSWNGVNCSVCLDLSVTQLVVCVVLFGQSIRSSSPP